MSRQKAYTIALRKRKNGDRFLSDDSFSFVIPQINISKRYWMADPFLFEYLDKIYLFYELYDFIRARGVIAYSEIQNNGRLLTSPKIIINRPFHLSFPYIYKQNNRIYIMPKTAQRKSIQLFKAISFPNKWQDDKVLIDRVFACDSIFIDEPECSKILTSKMFDDSETDKVISCYVNNRQFDISSKGSLNCTSIDCGVGEFGIRNAGKLFEYEGNIIRPGQNCLNGMYGRGLVFWKVDSVTPYKEEVIKAFDVKEISKHVINDNKNNNGIISGEDFIGCHTYNSCSKYEVVDLSYYTEVPEYYQRLHQIYRRIPFPSRCIRYIKRKFLRK